MEVNVMSAVEQVVANIQKEVRTLFKNSPVSERNAATHLLAAWELEQAAAAIRSRVKRKQASRLDIPADIKRS
jgi:hypothetical protein